MAVAIPPKVAKIVDVFVSIAAAVVIYGALQKLLHSPIADIMLKIGLITESWVLLSYGILYMVYPAVDEHLDVVGHPKEVSISPLKVMEKMLEEADITPANLSKLSNGFQKLGTSVSNIAELSDVVKSTTDFSAKSKEAAAAMGSVAGAVNQATSSLSAFGEASSSTKQFHDQVQVLAKNLTSLNAVYELELQEGNNHLKALNQFYGKLAQASTVMVGTADDAQKTKEQIAALAGNLSKLNSLYGNMITAMQGR